MDGNGNKIRYRYNLLNKLSEIIDQTGEKDYFTYDIEGRVRQHTDRRGNEVQYSYNLYDSLTEKLERKSGLRESYEYYPDGSIKSAIAEGMRYSYSYYANGNLKEKSASGKRLLSYEYDLNGNKIKQTDVTGKTTEYIYDELDQLLEIHDGGKCITAFKYNDDGTIKEAVSANGMKNLYGYDTDKNLTSLSVNFNGEILAKNRYAYDSNGNRTIKRQLRGTTYYTYDSINQLTNVKYPDYEEQLFYDKAGNRSKRIVNDVTEHYLYDKRNRLIRQVFQQSTGTTAKHYIYDNAGNLMNDGERIYKNDAFNRVTRVETSTGQVQINRYDAEGLRYEMEENKKLVQFIFNENREIIVEKSDDNIKRLIRSYDLWASECEPEKTWYHYASDEQGSIVFITDEEKICNKYDYDAWGNLTICEEIIPNRFLYTGQQFDQITQQYYLRARFYNPVVARFTQEDVYRGDGLNLYAYCDNNPVIYYDPSGYSACNGPKDKNPIGKNPRKRLPRTNGKWDGEPGESKWYSDKKDVTDITNGEGIPYKNGRPDFSKWIDTELGTLKFKPGELDGTINDFDKIYDKLQKQRDLQSKNKARELLKERSVTPHHKSATEIEFIPTKLHGNVPHIGSASDMRNGFI